MLLENGVNNAVIGNICHGLHGIVLPVHRDALGVVFGEDVEGVLYGVFDQNVSDTRPFQDSQPLLFIQEPFKESYQGMLSIQIACGVVICVTVGRSQVGIAE